MAIKPQQLWELPTQNKVAKEYFASTYAINKVAGANGKLQVGQELYFLPLIQDGFYTFDCHKVKAKINGKLGFKRNLYDTYILCSRTQGDGSVDYEVPCCAITGEAWDRYKENNKDEKLYPLIGGHTTRTFLPVLVLGNETGDKTISKVPVTKLAMKGRGYAFLEFTQSAFSEIISDFKNHAVNNGMLEYGLEGIELQKALSELLQKHILKLSIEKPDQGTKATHKKTFSFIPFTNKAIGAETGAYELITTGLQRSAKVRGEVIEFMDKFAGDDGIETIFTPYTSDELRDYVMNIKTATVDTTTTVAPKAEQVVTELKDEDFELDLMGSETPAATVVTEPVQQVVTAPLQQTVAVATPVQSAVALAEPVVTSTATIEEEELMSDLDDDDLALGDGAEDTFVAPPLKEPATVPAVEDTLSFGVDEEEDFFGDDLL